MADAPATTAGRGGTKTFAGQPWYVWAAGIGAVAIGYYLIKKQQSASAASTASPAPPVVAGSPTGTSSTQLMLWLIDHMRSPSAPSPAAPPKTKGLPTSKSAGTLHLQPITQAQARKLAAKGGNVYQHQGSQIVAVGKKGEPPIASRGALSTTRWQVSHNPGIFGRKG